MSEETWLTTAELAGRLSVSESTIRNWRKAFGDLMPLSRGHARLRRYALRPFELIAVLRDRDLPTEEIRERLAEALAQDDGGIPLRSDRVLDLMEQIAEDVRSMATDLRSIRELLDRPEQG